MGIKNIEALFPYDVPTPEPINQPDDITEPMTEPL